MKAEILKTKTGTVQDIENRVSTFQNSKPIYFWCF